MTRAKKPKKVEVLAPEDQEFFVTQEDLFGQFTVILPNGTFLQSEAFRYSECQDRYLVWESYQASEEPLNYPMLTSDGKFVYIPQQVLRQCILLVEMITPTTVH